MMRQLIMIYLYIYLDAKDLEKIKNRLDLPLKFHPSPNFFILGKDSWIKFYKETMVPEQIFVDIWNSGEWYAKDFLKNLEEKLNL